MLLAVAIALVSATVASQTDGERAKIQHADRIRYKGAIYAIVREYPLEAYFAEFPKRRPRGEYKSGALWRGYRATFEIRRLRLVVHDVDHIVDEDPVHGTRWESVLSTVWPHERPLRVDSFTGTLALPNGEPEGKHTFLMSRTFILLDVRRGRLVAERHLDLQRLFAAYRETEAGRRTVADWLRTRGGVLENWMEPHFRSDTLEWAMPLRDPAVIRSTDGIRRVRVIRDL